MRRWPVLVGAWRHREQSFRIEGFGPSYAALVALGSGRTNMMQGAVQLVLFASLLFLALVP